MTSTGIHFLRSILVTLTLCGCGSSLQWGGYSSTLEEVGVDDGALYHSAIRTLVRLGYGFSSRDEGARAIETEYRDVIYDGWGSKYSYSWRIITAGGELSIFNSCRHINQASFDARPRDCGEVRPVSVIDEEQKIRGMILADAKHVRTKDE